MFLRLIISIIVFLGVNDFVYAYRTQGVQRINPNLAISRAEKFGLKIPAHERKIKNELVRLKSSNKKEFQRRLSQNIENPTLLQGYLQEVNDGLKTVEKAKTIAKYQIYIKVEEDWDIIRTTALNTRVDRSFQQFRSKLLDDLEGLYYLRTTPQGYLFQVGQWAYVTVSKNLRSIIWRIEYNSKYDNNRLEEGAEDIQIQDD